ncbi:MAG: hypothetical protein H6825_00900 [Planctomycetes bacterium]|nr:hypothetical protein [Planctomycetota bacterium]
MLVDGHVLCAVSPGSDVGQPLPSPTTFYEFDPVTQTYTPEPAPNGASDPIASYQAIMLALPTAR